MDTRNKKGFINRNHKGALKEIGQILPSKKSKRELNFRVFSLREVQVPAAGDPAPVAGADPAGRPRLMTATIAAITITITTTAATM